MLALLLVGVLGFIAGAVQGFTALTTVTIFAGSLTMLGGLPVHVAIGASFMADAVTSFSISLFYWRKGNILLRSALPIIFGAAIGIQISARIAGQLPEYTLGSLFTVFMLFMGSLFIIRFRRNDSSSTMEEKDAESIPIIGKLTEWLKGDRQKKATLFLWGITIGLLGGLFGFSGGLITMIFLVFLLGFDLHKGLGTAIAVMCLISAFGSIGYASLGFFNLQMAIVAGIGGVAGGQFSSRIAHKFSEKSLNLASGLVFLAMGLFFLSYLMPSV